jgi:hypothetical protein
MLVKAVRGIYPKSFSCLAMILFMTGLKCIVNMINEEKEAKRIKNYKKLPMGIAMAMFPMMFKKHLKIIHLLSPSHLKITQSFQLL